jgi:hypothetical protein
MFSRGSPAQSERYTTEITLDLESNQSAGAFSAATLP